MRESDVNWMLAACVQSGAALVAIVGGLLGSRYVALDAEQQAARRRHKDATVRLGSARQAADQAAAAWEQLQGTDLADLQVPHQSLHANRVLTERDETARVLRQLQDEERVAAAHLRAVRQPQAFALALRVLAFIAATTIGLPLILMIPGPDTLPLWERIGVAAAFLSGVGLLLRYLFVYAAVLSPRVDRSTMPSDLIGLIMPASWSEPPNGAQAAAGRSAGRGSGKVTDAR